MKLKTIILLSLVFAVSGTVFGQQTDSVKTAKLVKAKAVKLPSAKKILKKYVAAIGGRKANNKIKSRSMKGTVELAPMGIKGTVESVSAPGKSHTKMNLTGVGEMIEAFDGTTAWAVNPIQGSREKTGEELLQTKLTNAFNREINLDKYYTKMEVKGAEKLGERDVYVVVGTPAGLAPETFYFDKQTGMLLRSDGIIVSPEGKMPHQTYYEDVREVDGVKMPFKTRTVLPQFELISIMTEVKHNVPVEDAKFARPKQ